MGQRASTKKQDVRKREQKIMTLANAGWHQEDIADELGISQSTVSKTIHRVLERYVGIEVENYRTQRLMALEHLGKPFYLKGSAGNEKSASIYIDIDKRMAQYVPGAEVPKNIKQDISTDEETLKALSLLAELKKAKADE